jgi:hypothetical protein
VFRWGGVECRWGLSADNPAAPRPFRKNATRPPSAQFYYENTGARAIAFPPVLALRIYHHMGFVCHAPFDCGVRDTGASVRRLGVACSKNRSGVWARRDGAVSRGRLSLHDLASESDVWGDG